MHQELGPEIMALCLQDLYLWLGFNPEAARLLVREQGIDSTERLRVLADKIIRNICNVMRELGGKNANGMLNRRQQVSLIAQEHEASCIYIPS